MRIVNLKNKKILVTGANGFLGGHIIEKLKNRNVQMLTPSHKELDLTQDKNCRDYFSKQRPHLVIHCAGAISGLLNILKNV